LHHHNSPANKDSGNLVTIEINLEILDLSFFVGDVIIVVGLGFFGPGYQAVVANPKRQIFSFLKKKLSKNPYVYSL